MLTSFLNFSFDFSDLYYLFSTLFRYSLNLITGNSLWMSDSDEDEVANVSDHSEERGETKSVHKLEADATSISVHPDKTKQTTGGTKSKRKSFVIIEDAVAGDYYQDVETGDTVWDVPEDGEVVLSEGTPKNKRKSFVIIEDAVAGNYYQDVETGDTMWDVPEDGEVVTSDKMLKNSTTKNKRKSFVKIEAESGGDYYQDVETGNTVWDVPSDSEVI